jgi:hypothetical protein
MKSVAIHFKFLNLASLFLRNEIASENEKIVTHLNPDCLFLAGFHAKQAG